MSGTFLVTAAKRKVPEGRRPWMAWDYLSLSQNLNGPRKQQ